MPIHLRKSSTKLKLKIVSSNDFTKDLEKIKSIPNARFNNQDKDWEVPLDQISDVINRLESL